ncbi:MAG: class I SAM-dependent methyltransferase [Nitrospirota bacterium]
MGTWFQTIGDLRYSRISNAYRSFGVLEGLYASVRMALCPLLDIEAALPANGAFVDVGCGAGLLLQWLALGQNSKEYQLVGMEIDSRRVDLGRRVCEKLGIASRVDLYVKSFGRGSNRRDLDAVIFIDVLHHMNYNLQKSMITYAFESLADGGILLIKDVGDRPILKYYYNYIFDAMTHITRITHGKSGYYRSQSGWEKLLREQGFYTSVIEIKHIDFAPHIMLVGKKVKATPYAEQS